MQRRPLGTGQTGRIVAVAVVVCALVLLLPVRTAFDVANGYLANALLRYGGKVGDGVVAIQRENPAAPGDAEMDALLDALLAAGPAHVLLVFQGPAGESFVPVGEEGQVTRLIPEHSVGGAGRVEGGGGLVVWQDPGAFGYYRPIGSGTSGPGASLPGFDWAILGGEDHVPRSYWVSYLSDGELMPIYDWNEVVDRRLPRSAFEGKIVVVATNEADLAPTPDLVVRLTAATVPPATYVANAIQALLDGRVARALPGWLTSSLMFLAAAEAGVILARLRDRADPWLLPMALAVIAAAGACVLMLTGIMFPLAETIASFALAWSVHRMIVDVNRRRRQRLQLRRLALVSAPPVPSASETAKRWAEEAADTAAALGLDRWVYFARNFPFGYKMLAVSADRFPKPALAAMLRIARVLGKGGQARTLAPIPNAVLGFDADGEEAWAVMLRTQDGSVSVWIVTCPKGWLSASPARRALLMSSAEQLVARAPRSNALRARPTLDEEIWTRARDLGEDAGTLDLLTRLASSAFAIYDLTGRPVRQNERMLRVAEDARLGMAEMSLLEALSGLTGLERDASGAILSEMIATGETQRMRLARPIAQRHYDLRLSLFVQDPVVVDRQGRFGAILCELLDVTASVRLSQARDDVTEFFDQQLRNDFEAIDLVVGMLTDETLEDAVRKSVAGRLAKLKARMLDRMRDFETALKDASGAENALAVPTEMRSALDGAIDTLKPAASQQGIELRYEPPALLSLAFAHAGDLETVFRNALEFSMADARSGGRVSLNVQETPTSIETLIETEGYGLPEEVVAALDNRDRAGMPEELRRVHDGVTAVEGWGGTFTFANELDRGIASKITLRKVR